MRRLVGIALCLLPVFAQAASLDVDPIRVTFTAQHNITVLTLTNSGDDPTTVQLELVAWSQDKGEDVYAPTHDLLATPPIFTVPPKAKQVIRLGLRVKPDAAHELCYRLYLQEVPQAGAVHGLGVVMALRIGIPVFVEPLAGLKPGLSWTLKRVSDKQLEVSALNNGNSHIQVKQVSLSGPGGAALSISQAAYVLPGATHTWLLPLSKPASSGPFKLSAETDMGTLDAQPVL